MRLSAWVSLSVSPDKILIHDARLTSASMSGSISGNFSYSNPSPTTCHRTGKFVIDKHTSIGRYSPCAALNSSRLCCSSGRKVRRSTCTRRDITDFQSCLAAEISYLERIVLLHLHIFFCAKALQPTCNKSTDRRYIGGADLQQSTVFVPSD